MRANFKQEALYSLVGVYLIGALWFGALAVKNAQDQAAKRAVFDPLLAGAIPIDTPFDPDKYLAQKAVVATTLVASDDLGRIPLFALGSSSGPQWLSSIWGTVRNDLPQPVKKVQLKALIGCDHGNEGSNPSEAAFHFT